MKNDQSEVIIIRVLVSGSLNHGYNIITTFLESDNHFATEAYGNQGHKKTVEIMFEHAQHLNALSN